MTKHPIQPLAREDVARFIEAQFSGEAPKIPESLSHYGLCELRQLMDYIYGGPPRFKEEELRSIADIATGDKA